MSEKPTPPPSQDRPRLVGRSSSHFTRVVRLFAEECGAPYELFVVPSLLAGDPAAYGGNPALRLPNLITSEGTVFGSLGSCRALALKATRPLRMIWPEATPAPLAANALELSVQAMSSEVSWIMLTSTGEGSGYAAKLRAALEGMLGWLEGNVDAALAALPERDLSYLELSLFCLLEHLQFRQVLPLEPYVRLAAFREHFAQRPSARATPFKFD
jgi:glutathione S-transferase